MAKLPLLILDLDGTLYQSDSLTKARDDRIAELVAPLLKLPPQAALEVVNAAKAQLKGKQLPGSTAHALEHLGLPASVLYEALNSVPVQEHVRADPSLRVMLQELAMHNTLALVSNSPKKIVVETLSCLGVADCFSRIFAGDEVGAKGDPATILKAVSLMGATPEGAVMVGDSYSNDILPSSIAGLKTVWLTHSAEQKKATATIKSIAELPAVLHSVLAR